MPATLLLVALALHALIAPAGAEEPAAPAAPAAPSQAATPAAPAPPAVNAAPVANGPLTVAFTGSALRTAPGAHGFRKAVLQNTGPSPVTVTAVEFVNDRAAFTFSGLYAPFLLSSGASVSFLVDFTPPADGTFTAEIRAQSAGGATTATMTAMGDASAPAEITGLIGARGTQLSPPVPTAGEGGTATVGSDTIIMGTLDKALIDAVIKRNMNQLRYCYQRELTRDATLAGKITVKFVIAKDGTVSSATTKSTTMANSAVEDCLNGRFMKFQFPEPAGGGIVIVSYPFVFSPG